MNRSTEIKLERIMGKVFNSIYGGIEVLCIVLGVVFLGCIILSFFW